MLQVFHKASGRAGVGRQVACQELAVQLGFDHARAQVQLAEHQQPAGGEGLVQLVVGQEVMIEG